MKTFFTSDTHFGHANIIRYSHRPFIEPGDLDVKGDWANDFVKRNAKRRMDAALVANWNGTVSPDDDVHHLGDFTFGGSGEAIKYLRQLNFKKFYFVWGNHDKGMRDLQTIIHLYSDLKDRVVFLGICLKLSLKVRTSF